MKNFIFKYRGALFIPAAAVMLILAKPTLFSLILGFFLVIVGEWIRVWAVGFTGVTTRDDKVTAPRLITAGPYAHLRNPLYLGNLISWTGFSIASVGAASPWASAVIFVLTFASYAIIYGNIIPYEEEYLRKTFGEPFDEYCQSVPRLLPSMKPYTNQEGVYDPKVIFNAEVHTIIMLLAVTAVVVLKFAGVIRIPLWSRLRMK
jgi:protein-S-isoprenylcysteine O-methyltransferase Ste14